jgi:hypothetical protein
MLLFDMVQLVNNYYLDQLTTTYFINCTYLDTKEITVTPFIP